MKRPDDTGFENRELSIDELDGVAGGGLFGWIKHEVVGGREVARLRNWPRAEKPWALSVGSGHINITIHRQN